MTALRGRTLPVKSLLCAALLAASSTIICAAEASLTVAASAAPAPYVHAYYDRSYQVFVGAGNLERAQQVIEHALYWRPNDKLWWQRYAEVCGWQGDARGALRGWEKVAGLSGDGSGWEKVRTLANASYNHRLSLQASKQLLQASPRDGALIDEIATRYELLGEPQRGLAFMSQWQKRYPSKAVLLAMQHLAVNAGDDRKGLAYYREYMRRYGVNESMAEQSALLAWRLGEREQAQKTLAQERAALPYSPKLESLQAAIAVSMGDNEEAMSSFETLIDHDDESEEDLRLYIVLARYFRPDRVADLMNRAWLRSSRPDLAMSVLYRFGDQGDWQAVDDFIQTLTPEQYQTLKAAPSFLAFQAQALMRRGQSRKAMVLLRQALDLAPNNQALQREWLWLLIASGDDTALGYSLAHWEVLLRDDPRNIGVLAAAHGALDDAETALRYQIDATPQFSSLASEWQSQWNAAQALMSAGKEDQAWPLLYSLWRKLAQLTPTAAQRHAFLNMQLTLSRYFESGDASLVRAQRVALGENAQQGSLTERSEWLAQWAAGQDEGELAQAWYLTQQRQAWQQGIEMSPSSTLAYAMLQDDYDSIARILTSSGGALSASERLQAQVMLDQPHLAAATFAHLQQGAPEQTGHNNLQEALLLPAETSTEVEVRRQRMGALMIDQRGVEQSFAVSDATTLVLAAQQRGFSSNDDALLLIDDSEQRVAVDLAHRHKRWSQQVALASRDLLGYSSTMADVEIGYSGKSNVSLNWRYQWQMPADESSLLQLGGSRTGQQMSVNWAPASSWQLGLGWSGYDYNDLDAKKLGSGAIVNVQQTWRPWLSRLSSGVRVRYTDAQFDQQRDSMAAIKALLPTGVGSTPLPQDYQETAIELLLGQPDVHIRPHRLHAWAELGYSDNSLSVSGFNGRLGVEGPLIGRDAWRFFVERKANNGGSDEDGYLIGLQYKIYY